MDLSAVGIYRKKFAGPHSRFVRAVQWDGSSERGMELVTAGIVDEMRDRGDSLRLRINSSEGASHPLKMDWIVIHEGGLRERLTNLDFHDLYVQVG